MEDHVLLSKAVRRPHPGSAIPPESASYDAKAGYWKSKSGDGAVARPPQTKKEDVETGEDVKGE